MQGARTQLCVNRLRMLYALSGLLVCGGFWLGHYLFEGYVGLYVGAGIAVASILLLLGLKSTTFGTIQSPILLSVAIGVSISAFFAIKGIAPSKFFTLIFGIMIIYKLLQVTVADNINHKKTFLIVLVCIEIVASIVVGILSKNSPSIMWQIFFTLVVAIFFSFGQLALFNSAANDMWRTVALSYILGFVLIFILIIVLAMSLATEDGSALELIAELTFGDTDVKKTKKVMPQAK